MNVFRYEGSMGRLTDVEYVSTLPEGFDETSYCADVHVSADGRFLYGSNRGHDSIVVYEINQATGRITAIQHEPTQGNFPRNFGIAPNGEILLVANQNDDNIVAYTIDKESGKLTPTGAVTESPTPICVKFLEL